MTVMLDRDPVLTPATGDTDRGQAAFTRTGLALYDLLVLRGVQLVEVLLGLPQLALIIKIDRSLCRQVPQQLPSRLEHS